MTFVILEDNADRVTAFTRVLREVGFTGDLAQFARADDCIAWLSQSLPSVEGLSLDHDLIDERPDATDPGDGRQVAEWLAQQRIKVPVIVHSSNAVCGAGMYYCLEDASFPVRRVFPLGEDWIDTDWKRVILENIIRESARTTNEWSGGKAASNIGDL